MKAKLIFSSLALLQLIACSSSGHQKQCSGTSAEKSLPASIEAAVDSSYRTPELQKRDVFRHPKETLAFFGVTPETKLIEIWPSGGWYTEILAPLLAAKGQYIIADPATDAKGYTKARSTWLDRHPEIKSKVQSTIFSPPDQVKLAPDNSVDMILTFRNVHNWKPHSTQEIAFESFFKALKPGGILGVVEHRAPAHLKKNDPNSGYVLEKDVIDLAKKAGFRLKATSEINANAKDTKNYPEGVWTLPPTLRLGEKDKDKYLAIGESDRMTLKFVKPLHHQ